MTETGQTGQVTLLVSQTAIRARADIPRLCAIVRETPPPGSPIAVIAAGPGLDFSCVCVIVVSARRGATGPALNITVVTYYSLKNPP